MRPVALFLLALAGCDRRIDPPINPDPAPKNPMPPAPTVEPKPTSSPTTIGSAIDKSAALHEFTEFARVLAGATAPCSPRPAGKVHVTFTPAGHVAAVAMPGGVYTPGVESCLEAAISKMKVPPFAPPAVTLGWSVAARR